MRQLLAKPRRCRRPPRLTRTIKPLASDVAKAVAVCDLPTLHMSAAIRTEQFNRLIGPDAFGGC